METIRTIHDFTCVNLNLTSFMKLKTMGGIMVVRWSPTVDLSYVSNARILACEGRLQNRIRDSKFNIQFNIIQYSFVPMLYNLRIE